MKKSTQALTSQPQLDVYRLLFDSILEQRLVPNTKLNEQDIAEIFGVSRTLIRQALQRLAVEQVVVIKRNKGAYVAAPDPDLAKQILAARSLIELEVTKLVCGQLSHQQVTQLEAMIALEQSAIASGDKGKALRCSGEFHLTLAQAAGNQPYQFMLNGLISQTSLIIAIYGKHGIQCASDEHQQLLNSLQVGEVSASQALMKEHLHHIVKQCDFQSPANLGDLKEVLATMAAAS